MTQQKGHFEGLGLPQRMGMPYSLSLSLLPLPVFSPFMFSHQGPLAASAPSGVVARLGMMSGAKR